MKKIVCSLLIAGSLAACSGGGKKVLVVGYRSATLDSKSGVVVNKNSDGAEDIQADLYSDAVTIGKSTVDTKDPGYYVINAKDDDTLIGSLQSYGQADESRRISQDRLKQSIDSMEQLVQGKTSPSHNDFFLPPHAGAKVTTNLDAVFVAPYHQMNTLESSGDKAPPVYRFWSIKETRGKIEKLKAMTVAPPSPNQ